MAKKPSGMHILDNQTGNLVAYYDNGLMDGDTMEGKWFTQAVHRDSLEGFETFDFIANGRIPEAKYLTGLNRVLIKSRMGGFREFIIFHAFREDGVVEVKANGSHSHMNKDKEPIAPLEMLGTNAQTIAEFACEGTEFQPGIIEYAPIADVVTDEYMMGLEFLTYAAKQLNMELQFRVEVEGRHITGRYVDMLTRVGEDRGKEIVYGKDLVGVTMEELSGDIVTALVVQGPEMEDGTKLTRVIEDAEAKARWGKDGGHLWGYHQIESENREMTIAEVDMYGRRELNKRIASTYQYKATAVGVESIFGRSHEKVFKGDRVRIKNIEYDPPLYMEARVFDIEESPITGQVTYTLGDVILLDPDVVRNTLRQLQKELREKVDRGEIIDIIDQGSIVKSVLPPENPAMNLLWLDIGRVPNVLYRWDGNQWVKSSPTNPGDIGAPTPEEVEATVNAMRDTLQNEIGEVETALGDFQDSVNGAFKDGIIEEAEAAAIEKYQNILTKEKADIDSQYSLLYNHAKLSGTPKTNLATAKSAYNTAHTNLVNSVTAAIADGKATAAEADDVDSKFAAYSTAFTTVSTRLEEALNAISQKMADDAEANANQYANELKQGIDQEIGELNGALGTFQDTVNTTFKDGIIEEAEAKALEKYKNNLNKEKGGVDAQYNAIYANVFLSGTPKTNLASAKTAYNTAHTNLLASVNNAIADGKTTAAEKADVDSKFATYNTRIATLETRFEQAVDEIVRARAVSESSNKAEIAKLQMEMGQIADAQRELGVEVTELNQSDWLQSNPVLTSLNNRQNTFNQKANELYSLIQTAVSDDNLTQVEMTNIAAKRTEYRSAMDLLIKEIKLAEAEITRVSANEVMNWGEKKIYRGVNIPENPEEGDLWVDSYEVPAVWKQYTNGVWEKITRTNIADMQGQITETQIADDFIKSPMIGANQVIAEHIAAGQITSDMVTTAGLDAAVITYGTMTGVTSDVGQAGMTAQGTVGTSTRFWAGALYANRSTAPFRVTQAGAVYASNVSITGGMIRGASAEFGGVGNQYGVVTVLDAEGELATELRGDIAGFDYLSVGNLYAPNKVEYADYSLNNLTIYVASEPTSSGGPEPSDDNGGTGWADAIKTIGEALRRIPKVFDGKVIVMCAFGQTFYELVEIQGFGGGGELEVRNSLTYSGATVVGGVRIINNSIRVRWDRVNIDSTQDYAGIFAQNGTGAIVNCNINGASRGTSFGINVNAGGMFEIVNVQLTNVSTCIRASYGGSAYASNCTGRGTQFGLQGFGGGIVSGSGTAPTGNSANTAQTQGGLATGTWTFPTPPTPPATKPVTTTGRWVSTDAGSYRFDENRWDIYGTSVNRPTQGSWGGYGPFQGSWFFRTGLTNTVSGKTIRSIRVYIRRITGGSSSSVSVRIKPHTSATRPGGNVSKQSPAVTSGFKVGEGKWVSLPSSFYAGFQSGSFKGITIDGGAYMKFAESATIEIRYE